MNNNLLMYLFKTQHFIYFQDIFDDGVAQSLLRKALPKNAVLKDNFLFNCEWCPISRKSVSGFASHIKRHVKQFILVKIKNVIFKFIVNFYFFIRIKWYHLMKMRII